MSQENVEIVRRGYTAYSRGDMETAAIDFAPDIEWIENPAFPEAKVYRGREEVIAYHNAFFEMFESWRLDVEEILDAGNDVLAFVEWHVRGKGSGAESTMRIIHRWTLDAGRPVRFQSYFDRREALEAVGLQE